MSKIFDILLDKEPSPETLLHPIDAEEQEALDQQEAEFLGRTDAILTFCTIALFGVIAIYLACHIGLALYRKLL